MALGQLETSRNSLISFAMYKDVWGLLYNRNLTQARYKTQICRRPVYMTAGHLKENQRTNTKSGLRK